MKSVQEWRDFVRLATDSDTEDLPDSLVDEWLREGVQLIRQRAVEWPFYRAKATLTTVAGTSEYDIPTTSAGVALRDITQVLGPYDTVIRMSEREAQEEYFTASGSSMTGQPEVFSVWGDTLTIYPEPDDAYTLTCWGYRKLSDWYSSSDASAVPDVPDLAEPVLNSWMLSSAFHHLSDTELATNHKRNFDERLTYLAEDQLSASRYSPYVQATPWRSVRRWWRDPAVPRRWR